MEIYIYNGYDINGDASDGRTLSANHTTSSIILDTGGMAGKTNMNFVRVWMPVWDKVVQGWPQIPASNVTMWGRASEGTNDGYWTAFLPDHTIVDVTPTVSGNWMHQFSWTNYDGGTHYSERTHLVFQDPQYSPYDYPHAPNPGVQKTRPTILWNGMDITDKTNVVWVGEIMNLECRLTSPMAGVTITNYFWQVPGSKIKDWVLSGTAPEYTGAAIVLWGTNAVDRTNATTRFCWTRDNAQVLPVMCTVNVAGQSIIVKSYFDVRRPEASLTLTPRGRVQVTTDMCEPHPWYRLTTGFKCTADFQNPDLITDVGILVQWMLLDLKGFTNNYEVRYVQLVAADWKLNIVGANTHRWLKMTGLDTQYPYRSWDNFDPGRHTSDTPNSTLGSGLREGGEIEEFLWRTDVFGGYLTWQSRRMPSIPVTLKKGQWDWFGRAQVVDTNTTPKRYVGVPPYTEPRFNAGVNWYDPPQWTNRLYGGMPMNLGAGKLPTP